MLPLVKRFAPLLSIALVAAVARADGGPTIHEYVPDLGSEEGTMLVSSGGAQPDAIVYQGEVLPAPEGGALREGEQPMRALGGDGEQTEEPGRRSPTFRPDRVTDLDAIVPYYTVFTPTIAPFKRVTAYDTVVLASDGTPIFTIGAGDRSRLDPLGADAEPPGDRPFDRFWGSVVLDFSEGSTVPLPSIAPEARILTLRTEPSALIHVERDRAGNFYATLVGAASEPVRVVFLPDAPRDYFGASLPDAPVVALRDRMTPLPAPVQRDAEAFAAELGLSRASRFGEALRALAAHFRSFEESEEPPRNTGNIYLDLARGMRGICRHRVYAFVITAQALGMHARFVHNEAHAWAEVELPSAGWLRVDLGGAATGLEAHGAAERPTYAPDVPDPLPRPEAYVRAYEQAQRMSGLRAPSGGGAPGSNGGAPSGGGGGGDDTGGGDPGGGTVAPTVTEGEGPRRPLELALDRRSFEVFRGRELEVTGVARGPDGGAPGLRIEVLLRAPRGGQERLLGVTVSREAGTFRGVFGVPPDLPVGDYRLVVRTPGDAHYAPTQAQ